MPGQLYILASLFTILVVPTPVGAQPPWKPQVSITSFERTNARILPLAGQTKRFEARYAQGLSLLEKGLYREARKQLEKATRLKPHHVGARRAHARALLTLGYLHWNRALVRLASDDVHYALWLEPKALGLPELASLIDGLLKRMDRATEKKDKPKT